ncbi:MAG: DUF1552 domain-containing protein [Deltaproteobacteria bacterium]|nr:MAG: DUF1552 domain-containing protein [Deltaproteobacteria bacterium]
MSKFPTRRSVLRGLLAGSVVTVGLPPLECMMNASGTAYAGTVSGFPTRFGLFYWGNGNVPDFWNPTGEGFGSDWTLSEQLIALQPIKHKISVLTGLAVKVPNELPHYSGLAGILSGAPGQTTGDESTMALPTIDQVIAAEVGQNTFFPSLETSVDGGVGYSHNGPHNVNAAEESPHALFNRLFGTGFTLPGDTPIVDPKVGLRRSVLDAILDDANSLSARVGAADRARLEQHMDGIRSLEMRLARMEEDPPNLASCNYPTEPEQDYPEIDGRPQLEAKSRAMCDILVMAYACDQTRVASHWISRAVGNTLFPGAPAGHHNLTHDEPGDQPEVRAIVSQVIAEYSYFLQALDAVPEGDGTLLDHCAILATSDVSLGKTHSLENFPLIVGGSANGFFQQDMHYHSSSQENASRLMMSLTRAMGLSLASFGAQDGRVTDGLSAIEV